VSSSDSPGSPKGAWIVRPGVPATKASSPPASAPPEPPPPQASPKIVRALQASPLFKSFTETGLVLIASIGQEKQLPAGTPLFVENMLGEALFVIASGRIRVSVRGAEGREQDLTELGPGDSLGEAALLRVGPRLCTATALTDAEVIEIARRDVAALQRTKPQACLKLMMGVVELIGARSRDVSPEIRRLVGRAGRG
jgi:CRP-like cAMP-binding protein